MTAPERLPLGAALALLLAVVTLTGTHSPALVAVAVALLGVLIGIAWPDLLELPSPVGTRIVVAGTGVLAAALPPLLPEPISALSAVVIVCAVGVFASFAHQMFRAERDRLTSSLTGTVAGVMLTGLGGCWVLAQSEALSTGSTGLVTAIVVGLTAALLLNATGLPTVPRILLAAAVGTATTVLLAGLLAGIAPLIAALIGLVTAVGACGAHLLLGSSLMGKEPVPSLAVAAAPVATAGVVAQLAVNLLT